MFNDLLEKRVQLLNEQYYGKNQKTLELEQVFSDIKKDMRKNFNNELYAKVCNKYEKRISSILKDLFNFKHISCKITNIGSINAYTYAKTLDDVFHGPLTHKEINKKYGGIRYTDEADRALDLTISLEIIRKKEITPAMLTGILLHEIGHNFFIEDTLVFKLDGIISGVFLLGKNLNFFKKISIEIDNFFKDCPLFIFIKNIDSIIKRYTGYVLSMVYVVFGMRNIFTINYTIIRNFLSMINPITGIINNNTYTNELFADNFATSYGYGPEIAKFSEIFEMDSIGFELLDSFNNKNIFFKYLMDMAFKNNRIFESIDPFKNRASEVTRVIDQLNYLKANLNNINNKEHRKSIENDINNIEKTLKEFEKRSNNPASVQSYTRFKNSFAFKDNKGEMAYRIRKRRYDNKGSWKNLI